MDREDPFARVEYRRLVAWTARLERELPFLKRVLGRPGRGFVLDVGCGTGEHVEALRREGYRAVGLDVSPALLGQARAAYPACPWIRADARRLPLRGRGVLAGALCLGNTLALLLADEDLARLFARLGLLLAPGAPFVVQILNYRRIRTQGLRHLPLTFRPTPQGEVVFLRLMDPVDDRRLRFEVLTLARRPHPETTTLVQATSSYVRSLLDEELEGLLRRAGFREVRLYGDFRGGPYRPEVSVDVVAVSRP